MNLLRILTITLAAFAATSVGRSDAVYTNNDPTKVKNVMVQQRISCGGYGFSTFYCTHLLGNGGSVNMINSYEPYSGCYFYYDIWSVTESPAVSYIQISSAGATIGTISSGSTVTIPVPAGTPTVLTAINSAGGVVPAGNSFWKVFVPGQPGVMHPFYGSTLDLLELLIALGTGNFPVCFHFGEGLDLCFNLVLVGVDTKEVRFAGAKYHQLKSDDGNTVYNAPHWLDTNDDGNATTSTTTDERNYPAAFTRSTKPQIGAKFKVSGVAGGVELKIKATSPQGIQIPETTMTPEANSIFSLPLTTSSTNLSNSIQAYNADDSTAFKLDWQIKIGSSDWRPVGSTKHTIYVTAGDPILTAVGMGYESLYSIGCRNAIGETSNTQTIVDMIFTDFQDRDVRRVIPSSGNIGSEAMTYWKLRNPPKFLTPDLLSSGDGRCGAWARMFMDVLRTQGIDSLKVDVTPPTIPSLNFASDWVAQFPGYHPSQLDLVPYFFVRNWTLGSDPFAPIDEDGAAGQGFGDPQSAFPDHSIVYFAGKFYDPSYGSGPFVSHTAWEDAALDAFGYILAPAPGSPPLPTGEATAYWIWKSDTKGVAETLADTLLNPY